MTQTYARFHRSQYGDMAAYMCDYLDDIVRNGITEKTEIPRNVVAATVDFLGKAVEVSKDHPFPNPEERYGIYHFVWHVMLETYKTEFANLDAIHTEMGRLATIVGDLQDKEKARKHALEDFVLLRDFFEHLYDTAEFSIYADVLED